MARKTQTPAEILVSAGSAPEEHALTQMETDLHAIEQSAVALADRIGYDGPLTLGGAEDRARMQMRRTVNECLELGKTLLIIRELTPHGGFRDRIEMLGLEFRTGQRFMQATLKFSKAAAPSLLAAAGSQSKLLELLVLDEDEIQALSENGSVRGVDLDDIERMSQKELRAALRESRETLEARDQVVKAKEAKISQLEEAHNKLKRRVAKATPDEVAQEIRKEAGLIAFEAEHAVRANLAAAFEMLTDYGGVAAHSEYMLGLITQIELALGVLRADYGLLKAAPDGDPTPHWMRDAAGGVQ